MYLSLSDDLVTWTAQQLVMAIPDTPVASDSASQAHCTGAGDPHWPGYAYSSILDPADASVNFDHPGRRPYLYLTRFNRVAWVPPIAGAPSGICVPDDSRDLIRVPIRFVGSAYARPKGATPVTVPLTVAYRACASPNRLHGGVPAGGSCAPPEPASAHLTVGTADSNGSATNSVGSVSYSVAGVDLRIAVSITDVRVRPGLADYTGELQADQTLRITDGWNGATQEEPATGVDTHLAVTVPCTGTGDESIGSTCAVATSANALDPGAVVAGKRAIWELGQVRIYDGGAAGIAGAPDATLFEDQGLFVP